MKVFSEVLGQEVEIPEQPARIVSFSPAATETLFEIGLGEKVVGVSAFCARPAEAKTKRKLGSYNTVRDEALDEVEPDLILTVTGYQREFAIRISKKYPVYPLELPVSVAGIVDFVVKVGLVAGATDRARELGGLLLKNVGGLKSLPDSTGYVEIDLGGPVTFGSYSYITDAFRLLGCRHLYGRERCEWRTPDLKSVAAGDPDLIVYEPKMFSKFGEDDLKRLISSRGWERLRAVREGNFFVSPGPLDFLAHHGPSFITQTMPWLEGRFRTALNNIGS
jgi:ABC-type Fe3+-hydroxamate transport system substrate-binding protein